MRTTIEIKNHHRAKLLELAARRGLKGFSLLVEEAIERYLESQSPHDEKVNAALAVLGTMSSEDAEALENSISEIRERWR